MADHIKSHLLALPAELRNHIWEYLALERQPIAPIHRRSNLPSITRVSRQVRSETGRAYYACNTFVLRCLRLGEERIDAVRDWVVSLDANIYWLRHLVFIGFAQDRERRLEVFEVVYHLDFRTHAAGGKPDVEVYMECDMPSLRDLRWRSSGSWLEAQDDEGMRLRLGKVSDEREAFAKDRMCSRLKAAQNGGLVAGDMGCQQLDLMDIIQILTRGF